MCKRLRLLGELDHYRRQVVHDKDTCFNPISKYTNRQEIYWTYRADHFYRQQTISDSALWRRTGLCWLQCHQETHRWLAQFSRSTGTSPNLPRLRCGLWACDAGVCKESVQETFSAPSNGLIIPGNSLPKEMRLMWWVILKVVTLNGCRSCTCMWCDWKDLPGAKWKFPATYDITLSNSSLRKV